MAIKGKSKTGLLKHTYIGVLSWSLTGEYYSMSRDFEEQLIDQLILDCSSLDQTAAAVFKAVFAAGRQSEFVKALTSYAGRKDSEIEKTCQLHYEQFAISIDILLGLREEAANLKQAVHSVLKELSYCGQLLFDTVLFILVLIYYLVWCRR